MSSDSILTVVTPAASQDLVTLAIARDELGNPPLAKNAQLRRDIAGASTAIANYCGRVFVRERVKELFRARGPVFAYQGSGQYLGFPADGANMPRAGEPLQLRRFPIISVTSITEDTVALVEDVDFEIDKERGNLRRLWDGIERPWAFETLEVTYDGGFAAAAIPEDLQEAALLAITARFRSRGRDPALRQQNVPGVLEQTFWVGQIGEDGAMPPRVTGLLDQYREVRV